jgi:hypothetical protein
VAGAVTTPRCPAETARRLVRRPWLRCELGRGELGGLVTLWDGPWPALSSIHPHVIEARSARGGLLWSA